MLPKRRTTLGHLMESTENAPFFHYPYILGKGNLTAFLRSETKISASDEDFGLEFGRQTSWQKPKKPEHGGKLTL